MTELAELTTFRVGGPAREFVTATDEDQLIETVAAADDAGTPVLLIGGGSNLLIGDRGFDGLAIRIATTGDTSEVDSCSGAMVTVAAGESWDAFVARTVDRGWSGLEALSGIPGSVGATPIQNVGAYGAEVAQTIARVRTYDRQQKKITTFTGAECDFSYRHSRFKAHPGRWVVLSVTFQLPLGELSAPVRYRELADRLGVEIGCRAPAPAVRTAVLALRGGKGMVLDADDHDTWSAGSFFTNPIVEASVAASLPDSAPRFPQTDGRVKLSAAWLIQNAGFDKGYGNSAASLSTKHVLALTNRGNAAAKDLLDLARQVRAGVEDRWGIRLVNEPVIIGEEL